MNIMIKEFIHYVTCKKLIIMVIIVGHGFWPKFNNINIFINCGPKPEDLILVGEVSTLNCAINSIHSKVQLSRFSLLILTKCFVLFVTSVALFLMAILAIIKSKSAIIFPCCFSFAL